MRERERRYMNIHLYREKAVEHAAGRKQGRVDVIGGENACCNAMRYRTCNEYRREGVRCNSHGNVFIERIHLNFVISPAEGILLLHSSEILPTIQTTFT